MTHVAGLDLSLSCTAIVVVDTDTGEIVQQKTGIGKSLKQTARWWQRLERHEKICDGLDWILSDYCDIACVVVEGPSLGSKGAITFDIGGMMYQVYRMLHEPPSYPLIVEVPPTNLKKFATGKGNCPKDRVGAYVQKRWDKIFDDNNLTDAFVLCQIGRAVLGKLQDMPKANMAALDKVSRYVQDKRADQG